MHAVVTPTYYPERRKTKRAGKEGAVVASGAKEDGSKKVGLFKFTYFVGLWDFLFYSRTELLNIDRHATHLYVCRVYTYSNKLKDKERQGPNVAGPGTLNYSPSIL